MEEQLISDLVVKIKLKLRKNRKLVQNYFQKEKDCSFLEIKIKLIFLSLVDVDQATGGDRKLADRGLSQGLS